VSFGSILLLALGLAMDATAVAAARGLATPRVRARHVLLVAGLFGGFQTLMPAIGWVVGRRLGPLIETWDHWIAFGLLAAIGAKMIWDSRPGAPVEERSTEDLFGLRVMLLLAIATSIDALAAGVTLPIMGAPFVLALTTIGVTTALLSGLGLYAGRHFGAVLGRRLDLLGGLVLIGLGVKTLVDHLGR
jgi:manganese efflux pump family protein